VGTAIPFIKMHGLGNAYIYLDLFREDIRVCDYAELARRVADPNTGIGSDGLILIAPSETADVKMRIFNKDGSEGKNCGNGLRCVAKYAYETGIVKTERFTIETLGGPVAAEVHPSGGAVETVTIDMGAPALSRRAIPMAGKGEGRVIDEAIEAGDAIYRVTAVSMGNPHALFFVEDIDEAPIETVGPLLADGGHPLFPEGANVGFIEPVGPRELIYRVWERGSGITQACGTGACAAVVAAVLNNQAERGSRVTVHLAGGDLYIMWDASSDHVFMTGPAEFVCRGMYFAPADL